VRLRSDQLTADAAAPSCFMRREGREQQLGFLITRDLPCSAVCAKSLCKRSFADGAAKGFTWPSLR
jgi:hypothetical protein